MKVQTHVTSNKLRIGILIILFSVSKIHAQEDKAIELNALFTGDFVNNFSGGLKTGSTGLGLMNMLLTLNTEKTNLWEGGIFHINAQSLIGGDPSQDLIGDVQIASNIEGQTDKSIYEFWYKQSFGKFSILTGLHNLNADFFVSSNAGLFLNSSFGVGALLSMNHGVSIYPITTLAAVGSYENDQVSLFAGIYNHGADFVDESSFHFKNHLFRQGFLSIAELQWRPEGWGGEYKLGSTLRMCNDESLLNSTIYIKKYNSGVYFLADQNLFQVEKKTISFFTQIGYYPFRFNPSPLFYALGANLKGFLTRKEEEIGLAFVSARINELNTLGSYYFIGNESVIELTGRISLNENIMIHPDFQYIINPSGTNTIDNAFIAILRLEMNF